jgi:group I intron endonuclease
MHNETINIWDEKNSIDHNLNLLPNEKNGNLNIITETKKKLIKKQWTDTGKISGIYLILNKINHKYYIGSSNDIKTRIYNHIRGLVKNNHHNKHLQRSWNKFGKENFECFIVEYVNIEDLLNIEQIYLNYAKQQKERLYNESFIAGKIEMTENVRKKISLKTKGSLNPMYGKSNYDIWVEKYGLKIADEKMKSYTDKMRKIMLGNNPFKGKKHNQQSLKKISESSTRNVKFNKTIYHFQNINTKEEFVGCKRDFVKKYNLHEGCIRAVISNKRFQHKDWTIFGRKQPKYALISDVKYNWFNKSLNLYRTCSQYDLIKEFNLLSCGTSSVITGRRKSHKGWILIKLRQDTDIYIKSL